ncbi:MAG: rhamnan synthesis F family protein, partial [Succinivibrio sp.]|uniref:rhamnan synthesis F family protein n=1 Tax=Succinivibrio sp. TaxID=2053619 RepID=UPI002F950563
PKHMEEIENDIKSSFDNVNIIIAENLGYDVAPFVDVLSRVNLEDYSYVIKLHTKRDVPSSASRFWFKGAKWRNMLLKFVKTKENFKRVLDRFENDRTIGMHGPVTSTFNFITDDKIGHKESNRFIQNNICKNKRYYRFVAGTMFMVKAELLKPIQKLNLKYSDFDVPDVSHEDCQLAHMLERAFGYLVYSSGYRITDCTISSFKNFMIAFYMNAIRILHIITDPFVSIRITKKNKLLVKIIKIPVLAIKLKNID